MERIDDLARYRRARGLTQGDLAALLEVTQQAVAKWEANNLVPRHRVAAIVSQLRIPAEALSVHLSRTPRQALSELAEQIFVDEVLVCFTEFCLHYCPTRAEFKQFWNDIQSGIFAHLSAGDVQVMLNIHAALRIDIGDDLWIAQYQPRVIGPRERSGIASGDPAPREQLAEDAEDQTSKRTRVYLRGSTEAYQADELFFDSVLSRPKVSRHDLAELHEDFQAGGASENSIFQLFDSFFFLSETHGEWTPTPGEPLHPDAMHLFESENDDEGTKFTWVHTRDILAIEVPTRLWEIHCSSMDAWGEIKRSPPKHVAKRGKHARSNPESTTKTSERRRRGSP